MGVRQSLAHKSTVERLQAERARLLAEIDALRHQIVGLDRAIELMNPIAAPLAPIGAGDTETRSPRRRPTPIKQLVLDLVIAHGQAGISAAALVEEAARNGHSLDRASVSSLLSRLKRDEILTYDGQVYRPAAPIT